ncbi:MAG TPA: hypothetical protein VGG89_06010 [Candidatus Baltobacteraceae bacterium]|jgi:hypothetical protein
MGQARILLAAALLLGGCGHAAQQTVAKPAATVDPEIRSLRAQLAQARTERDAALARLHALEHRKPAVVRVVVTQPAPAAAHPSHSGQPATQVFSNVTTAAPP